MRKAISVGVIVVIAIVVWHFQSASKMASALQEDLEAKMQQGVFTLKVSPFTNTAVLTFTAGSRAPSGVDKASLEQALAESARGRFDLLAMVSPYRAKIVVEKSGSWLTQAAMISDGNLWASPSAQTAGQSPLAKLTRGTPLMVLSATGVMDGKWLQVRIEDGRTGWVRETDVKRN